MSPWLFHMFMNLARMFRPMLFCGWIRSNWQIHVAWYAHRPPMLSHLLRALEYGLVAHRSQLDWTMKSSTLTKFLHGAFALCNLISRTKKCLALVLDNWIHCCCSTSCPHHCSLLLWHPLEHSHHNAHLPLVCYISMSLSCWVHQHIITILENFKRSDRINMKKEDRRFARARDSRIWSQQWPKDQQWAQIESRSIVRSIGRSLV